MIMKDEYNLLVVMLKNAYVTAGVLDMEAVCKQIRKVYHLLEKQYQHRTKMLKSHKKYIKQYLHNIKTYDPDVILNYGKTVIGILE